MKVEISTGTGIAIAGLLIALAIALTGRFEVHSLSNAGVHRTNKWTGTVVICVAENKREPFVCGD